MSVSPLTLVEFAFVAVVPAAFVVFPAVVRAAVPPDEAVGFCTAELPSYVPVGAEMSSGAEMLGAAEEPSVDDAGVLPPQPASRHGTSSSASRAC